MTSDIGSGSYNQGDGTPAAQRSAAPTTQDPSVTRPAEPAAFGHGERPTSAIERIARVLAARRLSANGMGQSASAGAEVDHNFRAFIDDATAILRALREPDAAMLQAGDGGTWTAMVRAALGEPYDPASSPSRLDGQIYQKPLG